MCVCVCVCVYWEDTLEKEMATHSSILAWRIPWTTRLQSMGSQSQTQLSDEHTHTHLCMYKYKISIEQQVDSLKM